MARFEELQRAPDRRVLDDLAHAVRPGSRVVRVARLKGGMDNGLHRLRLELPDGPRENVLLRRYGDWGGEVLPSEQAQIEWRTLQLLDELGVAAPKPLLCDERGEIAGSPAIVTSFLPGKPVLMPRDPARWAGGLATALAELHCAAKGDDARLGFLRDARTEWRRILDAPEPPSRLRRHPDGLAVWHALKRNSAALDREPECLVHYDYWVGNTIWFRGRLTGIIDWGSAARGAPAYDVAYMRVDLSISGRWKEADVFLERYEREAGRPVAGLPFWELLACLRAAPDPAIWLPGWKDLGGGHLTSESVRANYERKIRSALAPLA